MPWSSNEELAKSALEQAGVAVCITSAELDVPGPSILYVNEAYCRMMRTTRERLIGKTPRVMQGPLTERAVLDEVRRKLTLGEPFDGEAINYRCDGTPFRIAWRIDPVRDPHGMITHFVAWQRDVTVERNNEESIRATNMIDAALRDIVRHPSDRVRDMERLLESIVRASSHVLRDVGSPSITVVIDRVSFTVGDVDGKVGTDPDRTRAFPLAGVDVRFTGSIDVTTAASEYADFVDLEGMAFVAVRASASIEALMRVDEQRQIAVALQEGLLSPVMSDSGVGVAARYVPSTRGALVGGDWYDVIPDGDRFVYVIGDVVGHGVQEAAAMGRIQTAINILVSQGLGIAEVLQQTDRFCEQQNIHATCALVERNRSGLSVVSSGHLPPLLIDDRGSRLADVVPAPPLGFGNGRLPVTTQLGTDADRLLLLYTDGLIEVRGESIQDGLDYLVEVTSGLGGATPEEAVDHLIAARKIATLSDDLALCVFRIGSVGLAV